MQINSLILSITDDCNLQCKYCFVQHKPKYMNYQTCIDAINFLNNNSDPTHDKYITFFGGEPTLLWDKIIIPCVKYVENKQLKIKFNITTNGILLNEEKIKFLKQHNIHLLISMDGDKITQDYNRPLKDNNNSSFDILNKKLSIIKQYYPNITIRGTIYPDTCQYLFENIQFFINNHIYNLSFFPDEFSIWSLEQIEILKMELRKITLYYLKYFYNTEILHFTPYDNMLLLLNNSEKELKIIKDHKNCNQCGLGTYNLAINTEGQIFTCQELTSYSIKNNPYYIGDIYHPIDQQKIQNIQQQFLKNNINNQKNKCHTCNYKSFCNYDICHANSFIQYNNLYTKSDIKCIWQETIYLECLFLFFILKINNKGEEKYG